MSKRAAILLHLVLLLAMLWLQSGCGRKAGNDTTSTIALSPPLAWVGNDTISLSDFLLRYNTTPHVGEGETAVRIYLRALIAEKLLARMAHESGLDQSDAIQIFADQLHREAAVEELLEREVPAHIPISDSLEREHLNRLTHTLILSALVLPDSSMATDVWKTILSGSDDRPPLPDGATPIVRQPFHYDESTPELEEVAYSLHENEYGAPFKTDGRWWIVHVDSILIDPETSNLPADEQEAQVRRVITQRRREQAQNRLIAHLMKGRAIHIDQEPFYALVGYLHDHLPTTSNPNQAPLTAQSNVPLDMDELRSSGALKLDEPLISLTGFDKSSWTTGEVLEHLAVSPRPLPSPSSSTFAQQVYGEIRFLAEFSTLYEEAARRNYDQLPTVQQASRIWRDHLNAQAGLRLLAHDLGSTLPFEAPDTWDEASMSRVDSMMVQRFAHTADSLGWEVNDSLLATITPNEQPVMIRKTHFPKRPMYPMPVAYRWGYLWEMEGR